MPGSNASATNASPTTSRSSSSSSATTPREATRSPSSLRPKKKPSIVSGSMAEFGKETLQRRCPQSRSPHRDGLRRRHQGLQGRKGLHPRRGSRALPRRRSHDPQTLHLSLRRRLKLRLHRNPRARRRVRRQIQRRSLRPRHLERRHRRLRQAGSRSLPPVARNHRRRKHLQRQPSPRSRQPLVPSNSEQPAWTNSARPRLLRHSHDAAVTCCGVVDCVPRTNSRLPIR